MAMWNYIIYQTEIIVFICICATLIWKNLVLICNYFNYCYLKYFFPQDPSSNENQHPQAFIHFPVHVHSDNRDFQVKIKCVRKDQIGKYFRITVREREWESEIEIRLYCEGFTPAFKWTDKGDSDWPGKLLQLLFKNMRAFFFPLEQFVVSSSDDPDQVLQTDQLHLDVVTEHCL